ncbi:MAG: hypothetical protein K6G65_08725 [Lachnospiraceae bacterium]|nr:hypothetical protein [Lachnospiraceae bacterium]
MADTTPLTAPINNGQLANEKASDSKKSGSSVDKEQFLQLLVAQMKYQDPLEPTDNTEYVSQLATFSELEQMQNMSQTTLNSQAFSLVGQDVIVKTSSASGNTTYVEGVVDFVRMEGGKAQLSIEGTLYPIDDLYSVVGSDYIISKKIPSVEETHAKYDHEDPKDLTLKVSLGQDEFQASSILVYINGKAVESENLSYEAGKLTISSKAFEDLDAGKYSIGFVFNDPLQTVVADKADITIIGNKPGIKNEETSADINNTGTEEG